jgi:hypothetical protein
MTHYGDPSNIPASGIVMVSLSDMPVRESVTACLSDVSV